MPRTQGNGIGKGSYIFTDWNVTSQNVAGNYSNISWATYYHFQGEDHQLDNGYADLAGARRWGNGGRVYNYTGNFSTRDMLLASGSFSVGHNNDGNLTIWVANGISGYATGRSEGGANYGLPWIPRHAVLNSSPDFNDEQNPTFNYSNPAGTGVDFWFEFPGIGGSTIAYRSLGSGGGGNYTVTLTEAERNALRAKQPNAKTMTVRFVVHDALGGSDSWSWQDRTLTFINGEPTFTAADITYQDTDAAVVAITEDNQKIVQGKSDLNVSFAAATPKKSATIASYKITLDTDVQTKTAASTIDYGTRNLAQDTPVIIEVTDSRGFKTTVQKTISILPWTAPRAVITAGRVNNYEDTTNVKADVTIDSVNGKNAIQSIQLRYKKTTDATWTTTSMTTGVNKVLTLNKLYEWNLEITITDKFGSTVYLATVQKGIPIMFIDNAMLNIGINKFPVAGRILDISGDVYINDEKVVAGDSSGKMPTDRLKAKYRFSAYKSSASSYNDGSVQTVVFNTEVYDPDNVYDAATGLFVAPVDGYYNISLQTVMSTTGAGSVSNRWLWESRVQLLSGTTTLTMIDENKLYVYADGRLTIFYGKINEVYYLPAGTTLRAQVMGDTSDGTQYVLAGNGPALTHIKGHLAFAV